ncbi:MAG: TraU family protein, partial [Rhodospirillaceae bacterium]|nr:TraU family protein [Rhodospirillaceae bacterium]
MNRFRITSIGPVLRGLVLIVAAILLGAALPGTAQAQACTGRFVNPLTDVCWECLFPISIGAASIGAAAGAPDTPNPASPLCYCGTP